MMFLDAPEASFCKLHRNLLTFCSHCDSVMNKNLKSVFISFTSDSVVQVLLLS